MNGKEKKFGSLLRKAIKRISVETDKPIDFVIDDISIAINPEQPVSLRFWYEKRKAPQTSEETKRLGEELNKRGGFHSETELNDFYTYAGFSELVGEPTEVFDTTYFETPMGAVELNSPFYIKREKIDDKLQQQIMGWGTTTLIQGMRQTGKTSLLARGTEFARKQGRITVVYLSLQGLEKEWRSSLEKFLYYLFRELIRKIRGHLTEEIDSLWHQKTKLTSKSSAFMELMEEYILTKDNRILLAIDEGDILIPTDFAEDILGLFRRWSEKGKRTDIWRRFNFILVLSTEARFLIKSLAQSPFINVATPITTSDFREDQVRYLNQLYHSPLSNKEFYEFMNLFGGHPFLTRMALHLLRDEEDLTWSDLVANAAKDHGHFKDHLWYYRNLLRNKSNLRKGLIEIIKTQDCSDDEVLYILIQVGLVKPNSDGGYLCRCDLYKNYFLDKLGWTQKIFLRLAGH